MENQWSDNLWDLRQHGKRRSSAVALRKESPRLCHTQSHGCPVTSQLPKHSANPGCAHTERPWWPFPPPNTRFWLSLREKEENPSPVLVPQEAPLIRPSQWMGEQWDLKVTLSHGKGSLPCCRQQFPCPSWLWSSLELPARGSPGFLAQQGPMCSMPSSWPLPCCSKEQQARGRLSDQLPVLVLSVGHTGLESHIPNTLCRFLPSLGTEGHLHLCYLIAHGRR